MATAPEKNTAVWDALSRTDPAHTKGFNRAGGFKGTAIKPIWIIRKLTEQFGPCGVGWGINEPKFETFPAGDELLVYCTVSGWHGKPANIVWGIGGDKVVTKRQSGTFNDDEAFKKAFTDAVGNAFKFVGIGADVHMGLFEDSKYLAEVREEYADAAPPAPIHDETPPKAEKKTLPPGKHSARTKLQEAIRTLKLKGNEVAERTVFEALIDEYEEDLQQLQADNHQWWTATEYESVPAWIARRRAELSDESGMFDALLASMRENETTSSLTKWVQRSGDVIDALTDIQRRVFETEYEKHESNIMTMAAQN